MLFLTDDRLIIEFIFVCMLEYYKYKTMVLYRNLEDDNSEVVFVLLKANLKQDEHVLFI